MTDPTAKLSAECLPMSGGWQQPKVMSTAAKYSNDPTANHLPHQLNAC